MTRATGSSPATGGSLTAVTPQRCSARRTRSFYFRHTLTQGNADSQFTWPAANANWIPVAGTYTN